MRTYAKAIRYVLIAGTLALGAAQGYCGVPDSETIRASYAQAGNRVTVTLIIDSFSSASELEKLSQAFQLGRDQGLAAALSNTKTVGHCSIQGALGYDVAFIQVIPTPAGRRITFITSRPRPLDEDAPPGSTQPFDLAIGQFELNDSNPAKSTGFLFPASKLVIDELGQFHYDLAGASWSLVNVLDSSAPSNETLALAPTK